jgi:hypothetical protein
MEKDTRLDTKQYSHCLVYPRDPFVLVNRNHAQFTHMRGWELPQTSLRPQQFL